jgi:hypothetical protein
MRSNRGRAGRLNCPWIKLSCSSANYELVLQTQDLFRKLRLLFQLLQQDSVVGTQHLVAVVCRSRFVPISLPLVGMGQRQHSALGSRRSGDLQANR